MAIMKSERMVKWSKEALDFWEESPDNSVILQCVISYGCVSQTDEGFEDLVNTLNSFPLKNKIKKLYITDTSYLYRHCIHEFSAYCDKDVPTIWYLNNKAEIEKLEIETEVISWADGLKRKEFKEWHERILKDFGGDSNGNGIVRDFRDLTFVDASLSAYKGNYELPCCIDFMLEECAYACAFLQDSSLLYPMGLARCMKNAFNRYGINAKLLNYKTSRYAQKHTLYRDNRFDMLDKEIAIFMKEKVSNVNFFVIDKFGNHIYKNYALEKVVGDRNAKELTEQAWNNCQEVMRTEKRTVVEEQYNDVTYLSVKSPLIIDGEVEGVMGLAVDITERKKLELLERRKEVQNLAESVAHDIRSPLMVLSILANDAFLPEKKHTALRNVIGSIERILGKLLSKYNNNGEAKSDKEESICVQVALVEALRLMRYQYSDANVEFDYVPEASNDCFFLKGDYSDFCRMMFNLMNNAVEALRKNAYGVIKIGFTVDNTNNNVSIYVKDNGCGMPAEIIEKIKSGKIIQTTKNKGHGLGMKQIMKTVNDMNGVLEVNSKENVGTEFRMTFSKSSAPLWFSDKICLKKGDVVIVLDDDPSIFEAWKDVFEPFSNNISVKYLTNGREVLNFISSFDDKSKLFLLADYELRGQELDGIDIIEHSGMQGKSLLVTSSHASEIRFFSERCGAFKMFSKLCGLDKIKVIIE